MCEHIGMQMWMVVDADGGGQYKGKRKEKTYLMRDKLDADGCGGCRCDVLQPVLLAGREMEQRRFGGQRDLDYSALRVQWLRTPLHGKADTQGTRPSKPEKKGTCPIGNSRGIAARVG